MKKSTITGNKIKSVFVLFLFLIISAFNSNAQTITSSVSGGNWSAGASWIGGIVPTAGSNVIINSAVYADGNVSCNNLTVNSGCFLYNTFGYSVTVSAAGYVINNGSILNHPNGYTLSLNIQGNITNNGIWNINSTRLSSTLDQGIQEAAGKAFEGGFTMSDSLGDIILNSNVMFKANTFNLNKTTLRSNGFKLQAIDYIVRNGSIFSNDSLLLDNTVIETMKFFGDYKLDGNILSQSNNIFNGNCTILDTLFNKFGYSNVILVNGSIVNKGTIKNHPNGYTLSLDVKGNISNEGIWSVNTTNLISTADQTIDQTPGKRFEGAMNTTDSIGDIILASNVMLESNTWNMNNAKLRTNGYKLLSNAYTLANGRIISNDSMVLDNSIIQNMKFFGNYVLGGNILSQSDNVFNDNCTIIDTLFNKFGYSNTILINGNIVNKGTIARHPSGYTLSLDIKGNVNNEGLWNPNSTNFINTADQTIQQAPGKRFEGVINTTDSIGDIILASNVILESNTWNMNNAKLRTNGYKLLSNAYTLANGKIISNDSMVLDNSIIQNMKFFGNYVLGGNILSQSDNVFNDNCTIIDTLFNRFGYSNTIIVNGNIVNKGTIARHPSGYTLSLDIKGNVNNEGIWNPNTTNFINTADQTIQQAPGKRFEGVMNTTDSIGDIMLASNVLLESNTWNMNNAKLRTNGHKLLSNSYTLTNGKIISNDSLILDNSIIQNMKFFGNYVLGGNVFSQSDNVFNDSVTIIDTLYNRFGYSNTILVNGSILNKGMIAKHPSGYTLTLDIKGNVRNEGIWRVNTTNFINTADQTIQQTPGKIFEGAFNTTDSIGSIILGSNVMFESSTWIMNKAKLFTNGHNLLTNSGTLINGKIISNDTLALNNSVIESIQLFGNCKLNGNVYSKNNNVFNDTLTVLDTLANLFGYSNTILVNGDLINKGSIMNNPGGYVLNLQVKGNLTNNHIFTISNLWLIGTNARTISGSNAFGMQAAIAVDDSIRLVGDNMMPNISFTSNSHSWCTVDSAAALSLKAISNPGKILNFGRVSLEQNVDNTIQNTLTYYQASMKSNAGVLMTKLTIDHYGYQQHPTSTEAGAVNCWWRLRNYTQNFSDSLAFLKLNYNADALNGNLEDSIKVFYSPNAGLTWNKIASGVSIDTASNTVTITNAPAYGHYQLSSTSLGITAFHPMIENVEPKFGGNSGTVTLYIFGAGLKNTSIAKLRLAGQSDITADTSYLTDGGGESMLARFNLKNKNIGIYDVVVETPSDSTLIKTSCFTVADGERSKPWVSLSGRDKFLLNRWQTFNLNYGNTANVDAVGTVLVYVVNNIPGLTVTFPDFNVELPQSIIDLGPDYTRIADSVALYYVTDTLTGYIGIPMRVYPFYIPHILAGSSRDVRVKVLLSGSGTLKMSAWVMDPFWENIDFSARASEPIPAEVRDCISAAAMKGFSSGVIGLIPGMSCYGLVDKITDPPEKAETWGSWLWNGVSYASSITQCATSFMPGIGQATSLGISFAGMMIDMKDGADANAGCWAKFRKKSDSKKDSKGVTSFDPNEIAGPQGFSADNYISKLGNKSYRVFFENKDTATASALEVFVYDTLDITKFDLNTFSFNTITFGDTVIHIQDYAKEFTVLVDMYPHKDIIVQVHGVVDTLNGAVSWGFHSLDRITLELTEDPDLGFLPPNVNYPEGEGNVAFSCKLKETVVHDDIITNKASVVFDFNAPLNTNTAVNKIDAIVPVSSVASLNSTQTDSSFTVTWSGNDQGCGVMNYNIFVSDNDSAYIVWKPFTNSTSDVFKGSAGHSYKFFCIASDSVGLTEAQKVSPEASTLIATGIKDLNKPVSQFQLYPNPASDFAVLKIDNQNNTELTLNIYSVVGELIRSEKLLQNQRQINLHDLGIGIYMVEIKSKDWSKKQKLIIQR